MLAVFLASFAAGWLFVVGVAFILAELGAVRAGFWTTLASTTTGAVVAIWLLRTRFTPTSGKTLQAARTAELLAPELGSAPTSAIDLSQPTHEARYSHSSDLVALHLDQTAGALARADLPARLNRKNRQPKRWLTWILMGCAAWFLILLLFLDTGRSRLFALLVDPSAARISDVPLTGDIQLTYRYPEYTGLPPRIVEGGDGSITAVVGTEVEITAVADMPVRRALLRISESNREETLDTPMQVDDQRRLRARLSVLRDARYHFAFIDADGDRIEERISHAIRATLDAYPEIHMDSPSTDVELKDDQHIDVLWRARDDFGIDEVHLVLERPNPKEAQRVALAGPDGRDTRREGRYRWAVAQMKLAPGEEARFYLEALDNDATGGPKRAVSASRRLSLFSARRQHEELLERQRSFVDALVDWLAADLLAPFPPNGGSQALTSQRTLLGRIQRLDTQADELVASLRADELTAPEITTAFTNVSEHIQKARLDRTRSIAMAARPLASQSANARLVRTQKQQIAVLEKDIIYLDDLLALQRIDELKQTAKELLAAQRNLQDLLARYRETRDPALRAGLEQQIRALRRQMMELMTRMAQIKENLPGEYRNLESAAMLQVDDALDRLEHMLRSGDLDAAARELEQLANMLENMVNAIDRAEQEYGGERYAELRQQLAEFAAEFEKIEGQQKALAKRAERLLGEYRKAAIERAGNSLDAFVQQARKKAAQALEELDQIAGAKRVYTPTHEEVARARERLLDLDALLEGRDFSEAQALAAESEELTESIESMLDHQARWRPDPQLSEASRSAARAARRTRELKNMLAQLFPAPGEVLSAERLAQMQRMAKKQQSLEEQAEQLGQKMDALAAELPLFGGSPRASLQSAEMEMGDAALDMRGGRLPGAAHHKRRAVEELGKLRQALEQAAQGNQGGLPLPLGGGGRGRGGASDRSHEPVEIPQTDKNRADPRFRKDLLEAAKQKAPERYEEAVRQYYEELIK